MPEKRVTQTELHKQQFILFKVDKSTCAFSTQCVFEIIHLPALSKPPGLPDIIEGFIHLATTVLPVIRLNRLFRFDMPALSLYTPIILVRSPKGPRAFLVDAVDRIESLPIENKTDISSDQTFKECLSGMSYFCGQTVSILDPDRLLLESEQNMLAEFRQWEERRISAASVRPPEGGAA